MGNSLSALQNQWARVLPAFRRRGVVFFSRTPFWERAGFVQQSLARTLVESGVRVHWWDGTGWRDRRRWVPHPSRHLTVEPLWSLPGRRFAPIQRWNDSLQVALLQRFWRASAPPIFWVQDGLDDRIAERLPAIDIYSVFDDPYVQDPPGALCTKAKQIVAQNEYAEARFASVHPAKTRRLPPPIELSLFENTYADDPAADDRWRRTLFPAGGVQRVFGYLGTHFHDGFDFDLFERCLEAFPDAGFLLVGRTDAEGTRRTERLRKHPRFHSLPWLPRIELPSLGRRLAASLLFYTPDPRTHGAFPVKSLEAMALGVPSVATDVPKTRDLRDTFTVTNDFAGLCRALEGAEAFSKEHLRGVYEAWRWKAHPLAHLVAAGEVL